MHTVQGAVKPCRSGDSAAARYGRSFSSVPEHQDLEVDSKMADGQEHTAMGTTRRVIVHIATSADGVSRAA